MSRKRRVRMFERRCVLVRGFLFASEHHLDPALGIELDHHVRALVGDPDIVVGVDLHCVRERPGIKVVADLPQIIAVGVKLEELRRRRAVGRAGRGASMQHEDVVLRIERDAGNLAQIEIGRQMQKIRNGFIRNGRDVLGEGKTWARDADSGGAGKGKKLATGPRRARTFAATRASLPGLVAHCVLSHRRHRRAGSLFVGLDGGSDSLRLKVAGRPSQTPIAA